MAIMAIKVNATVVDLTSDSPRTTDKFFIDSNVWFWVGYTKASLSARPYQIRSYPNYLSQALTIGSTLYKCTLSFAELAHQVEQKEWDIFKAKTPSPYLKDFRHNFP